MLNFAARTVIRGNITREPKYFPARNGMDASLKIPLAVNRSKKTATGWEDAGAVYLEIDLRRGAAESTKRLVDTGQLGVGTPLVAFGEIAASPHAYISKNGEARASHILLADGIALDLVRLPQNKNTTSTSTPAEEEDPFFGAPEEPDWE
jgi:hypothetical protein